MHVAIPAARAELGASAPPASTFAGMLLDASEVTDWPSELLRFARGLALASLFGVALGTRAGGLDLVVHGLGVPLAFAAAAGLGVPSFLILLLHSGLEIDALRVAATASRAVASAGLLLGGLAPLAALLVVTSEQPASAAAFAWFALSLAGVAALMRLRSEVRRLIARAPAATHVAACSAAVGFSVLASLIALRIWTCVLPVLSSAGAAP